MIRSFSTLLLVHREASPRQVGVLSRYKDTPHLGTGKKIEGWKWGERRWASDKEIEGNRGVSMIWDPSQVKLPDDFFQSGYGDGEDIHLVGFSHVFYENKDIWASEIFHGFFFSHKDSWYLYGDGYRSDYFVTTDVLSGEQFIQLSSLPKQTIPISVRRYSFDPESGKHIISLDFKAVEEFSSPSDGPEYKIDYSGVAPILTLNGVYNQTIGSAPVINAGILDLTSVQDHEKIGQSLGEPNSTYFSNFSPIDESQTIEVLTYLSSTDFIQWTVIPSDQDFTSSTAIEVKIDIDLGIIQFGERVPPVGSMIMLRYTPTIAVQYEPEKTLDTITSVTANINPLYTASHNGFVEISPIVQIPTSIILSMEDVTVSGDGYIVQMGNSYAKTVAEVLDQNGVAIEGIAVTFELLGTKAGTFGNGLDYVTSRTVSNGKAYTFYQAPSSIDDLAIATNTINIGSGETQMTIAGLTVDSLTDVTLFQIVEGDPHVGALGSSIPNFYTSFLLAEGINDGVTDSQWWESNHRLINNLLRPVEIGTELIDGRKQLVVTNIPPAGLSSINPHTGNIDNSMTVPLIPSSVTNLIVSGIPTAQITFPAEVTPVGNSINLTDGTYTVKSYAVVGTNNVQIRAYVRNMYTGRTLYSNTINISLVVPDTMNGTYITDILNNATLSAVVDVTNTAMITDSDINATQSILNNKYQKFYEEDKLSGETYVQWFRRSMRGDTVSLQEIADAMNNITPGSGDPFSMKFLTLNNSGANVIIPLGFRLKSSQATLASILDSVVYYDVNDHLPSGYWL